jgi:hypothetical protein
MYVGRYVCSSFFSVATTLPLWTTQRQANKMKEIRAHILLNLKIDCALLSKARHCFMTIVNRERIAINQQVMIAGRCVFMKTIYIVYMKDYSTDHLQIICTIVFHESD